MTAQGSGLMMQNPVPHHCGWDPRWFLGLGLSVTWDETQRWTHPPLLLVTRRQRSILIGRRVFWSGALSVRSWHRKTNNFNWCCVFQVGVSSWVRPGQVQGRPWKPQRVRLAATAREGGLPWQIDSGLNLVGKSKKKILTFYQFFNVCRGSV